MHHTHDLRANMRDVRADPAQPYAPHTRGRNSWSIGISLASMRDATPSEFGRYPITEQQLDGVCRVAARLATFYAIDIEAIRTHAEAALDDGYFGDGDDQRWDIARLRPAPEPLTEADATAAGDWFRDRIAELQR